MGLSFLLLALAASASAGPIFGSPQDSPKAARYNGRTSFEARDLSSTASGHAKISTPVRQLDLDAALGLRRRAADQLRHIRPTDEVDMAYGARTSNGHMKIAQMKLFAQDALPIVLLEQFEDHLSAVECTTDGNINLKWNSRVAFEQSLEHWTAINHAAKNQMLVITNHAGCGSPDRRLPFKVGKVVFDETDLGAQLRAEPVRWKQVATKFTIDFGKAAIQHENQPVSTERRFAALADRVVNAIKSTSPFGNPRTKNIHTTKTIVLPVDAGTPGKETVLFEDFTRLPNRLKVTCVDCFVQGSFRLEGRLEVHMSRPSILRMDLTPQDVVAELKTQWDISSFHGANSATFEKILFEAAIPGAGIDIPDIFTLGAKFRFKASAGATLTGSATALVGAKATLPNNAVYTIDLVDHANSGARGFEASTFEPIMELEKASLTANLKAGPSAELLLAATILSDRGLEASMSFNGPTINLNATVGYDKNGFCEAGDPVTTGVQVVSAARFTGFLSINEGFTESKRSLYQKSLFGVDLASFVDKCFPLPGLTPPTNGTGMSRLLRREEYSRPVVR